MLNEMAATSATSSLTTEFMEFVEDAIELKWLKLVVIRNIYFFVFRVIMRETSTASLMRSIKQNTQFNYTQLNYAQTVKIID
jgi:uncharacterized membrane protein